MTLDQQAGTLRSVVRLVEEYTVKDEGSPRRATRRSTRERSARIAKHLPRTPAYLAHPYQVAEALLARGVALIGTDTLSPDETPAEGSVSAHAFGFHERFLGAGGVTAENLTNLEALVAAQRAGGRWIVNLVPLRLDGADGSPVRAFAHGL
ncbi:hypothetical protein HYPSUDRAFT_207036 [Hypholoma sublateritium FD-334 SS-4]|uniref:Cyclase n=1 Tax=Hypholoma sublateritium (strain FD-334 SS-4) TaxID=945553 RepID=A0A0D2NBA4_HYPSF|nr:hypothetical protein HYPSUDRAFT_207036 [Hypholoma sublateritium FD-334 SS-4]